MSVPISSLYQWTDYDPCYCCTNLLFIYNLFICLFIYLLICFLIFLVIFIIFLIFFFSGGLVPWLPGGWDFDIVNFKGSFWHLYPCVQNKQSQRFLTCQTRPGKIMPSSSICYIMTSLLSRLSFLFVKNIVLVPSWWRGASQNLLLLRRKTRFARLSPPADSRAFGDRGLFLTDCVKPSLWQRLHHDPTE